MMGKKLAQSLLAKTVGSLVVVLVIVLGVGTFVQLREKKQSILTKLNEVSITVSAVMNSALHNAMLKNDTEGLQVMLERTGASGQIKDVFIADSEGKIARSSNKDDVEKPADAVLLERVNKSHGGALELKKTPEDRPYMASLSPVMAEKPCLNCHSGNEGDTLGYLGVNTWATNEFQQLKASQVQTLLWNLLTIMLLMGAVVLIIRAIVKPLAKMTDAAREIATGDIDQKVNHHSQDELGVLANSFRDLIDYIKSVAAAAASLGRGDLAIKIVPKSEKDILSRNFMQTKDALEGLVQETALLTRAAKEGQLSQRGNASKFQGGYRELVQGINETLDTVVAPIHEASEVLRRVAERDVTAAMQGHYQGDFAKIKEALNTAVETLNSTLTNMVTSAQQVASASGQISSGSQTLAQGASEQASSLEEVSSSLQEMASMTKQNTANAKEARSLSEGARSSSERGVDSMKRLSASIDKIKASSDATAKIVKTIDEIAFQTNLLALNAAVEAARAGDAGKGFAVVAEEVRNLAMRSAEAAKNTANLIEESVSNTKGGVAINQEVLKNLEEINLQVNKVSAVMAEVVAASDQQSQGVDQIATAVEQMNQLTQQIAANAEESASSAEELSSQAEEMHSLTASFQLRDSEA